ncbi:MAG: molybdenum cofactor biosynthesis protein [Chloroflexi bacterium]|nr:molybdenum cofactor biosynthesis protein [Chloroflexota bacterium]MCH2304357.1 MogA/MoaB family molybdenum cofactor biosynthesis protein [SAR202 cluster bacterium]
MFKLGIITISDSASIGKRNDSSGKVISDIFKKNESIQEVFYKIIPDDIDTISSYLIELSDNHIADIIITTGGTGLGPRDLTPEATKNVLDKEIPGITEAMRLETLKKTNLSMLSRGISGLRKKCLIINLPGSPKAVSECMEIIEPVLEHALTIISGKTSHK